VSASSSVLVSEPVVPAGWALAVYPEAGEAGGSFRGSLPARARDPNARGDPERSRAEAGRRARGQLRRYCAANGLNRLGTLTYAGAGSHDPRAFRADLAEFFRALRSSLGGEAFPYAWVPEWHKSGHGLHAHFAVGRFIARRKIEQAWGRGFVHIKLLGDLPVGSGSLGEARVAARYLSKYVGKEFSHHQHGLHRYDVGQGFQPRKVRVCGPTMFEALDRACEVLGSRPVHVWQSGEVEDWQGPPAVWASWR
jgi:hypothetical protein